MMDHIIGLAVKSAVRHNAQMRNQRNSYKRIFKLDAKKRALDREGLSRSQYTFLYCGYQTSHQFINAMNSIKPAMQAEE